MEEKNLQEGELYERRFGFKEKRANNLFMLLLVLILAAFASFAVYFHANFSGVQVSGPSMLRTLNSGEYLLMRKVGGGEGFTYGDIVVVSVGHYPEIQKENEEAKKKNPKAQPTEFLIKRVVAMEGDKVKFENGQMWLWKDYRNGGEYQPLEEDYAYYSAKSEYQCSEYTVGEGEVFFLGDNRNASLDSRYLDGKSHLSDLYKAEDICGVVPDWAVRYRGVLEWVFFARQNITSNK